MVNFSPPSMNPASQEDPTGIVRLVLSKFLAGVDDMLPAQVISYNRTTNRANVQPLIMMTTTDKKRVTRASVTSVPVLQLGGGGFVASFPIKAGDLGWIKANDRDITFFKRGYQNSTPNTQRKHSFEDALFIPDSMMNGVVIASEDVDNLVLLSGIEAVVAACETISKSQLGEMVLTIGQGIPNFETIWVGSPNYALYQSYLRSALLAVSGVLDVQDITLTVVGGVLQYTATIITQFGTAAING